MVFGGLIHNKKMIQSIFTPKDIEGVRQAVDAVLKQVETTYNDHVAKATTAATTKVKDFKEAQQLEKLAFITLCLHMPILVFVSCFLIVIL